VAVGNRLTGLFVFVNPGGAKCDEEKISIFQEFSRSFNPVVDVGQSFIYTSR